MAFSTSAFMQTLVQQTARLSNTLESAKAACLEAGRPDVAEWINLELHGYKGTGTLFAYRRLPGVVKSVITNDDETLDDYTITSFHSTVTAGVNDLVNLPELQEALRHERNYFTYSVDHDTYVYRRLLAASRPGYLLKKAWAEVPFETLPNMVQAIGERLEEVLANLNRKPSWW